MAHQDVTIPPGEVVSPTSGSSSGRESWTAMLAALLSCLVFVALYYFRELDDNRLVSWRWVFANLDVSGFFITIAFGAFVGYMLSTLSLPGRRGLFALSIAMGMMFINTPEVIIDSSRYFTQAKHLSVYGPGYFISEWGREIVAWTDLPLMPFERELALSGLPVPHLDRAGSRADDDPRCVLCNRERGQPKSLTTESERRQLLAALDQIMPSANAA